MLDQRAEEAVTLRTRGSNAMAVRVMVPTGLHPPVIRYRDRLYVLTPDGGYTVADVWPVLDELDRVKKEFL